MVILQQLKIESYLATIRKSASTDCSCRTTRALCMSCCRSGRTCDTAGPSPVQDNGGRGQWDLQDYMVELPTSYSIMLHHLTLHDTSFPSLTTAQPLQCVTRNIIHLQETRQPVGRFVQEAWCLMLWKGEKRDQFL